MTSYQLSSAVRSPGRSITFLEFSPNGRFLAVGDRGLSSLSILDKCTGYHPNLSTTMPAEPRALVWDASEAFYVGLGDGCFIHCQIDHERNDIVKGAVNSALYGVFPVTAIALHQGSNILAVSVGPEVFLFQRARTTSGFTCNYIASMNLC